MNYSERRLIGETLEGRPLDEAGGKEPLMLKRAFNYIQHVHVRDYPAYVLMSQLSTEEFVELLRPFIAKVEEQRATQRIMPILRGQGPKPDKLQVGQNIKQGKQADAHIAGREDDRGAIQQADRMRRGYRSSLQKALAKAFNMARKIRVTDDALGVGDRLRSYPAYLIIGSMSTDDFEGMLLPKALEFEDSYVKLTQDPETRVHHGPRISREAGVWTPMDVPHPDVDPDEYDPLHPDYWGNR